MKYLVYLQMHHIFEDYFDINYDDHHLAIEANSEEEAIQIYDAVMDCIGNPGRRVVYCLGKEYGGNYRKINFNYYAPVAQSDRASDF